MTMELALNEDQSSSTRRRCGSSRANCRSTGHVRCTTTPSATTRMVRQAAELGWFTMLVPEADGGGSVSGNGLVDAALIAEELGRFVQPGPFIPMNVVAAAIAATRDRRPNGRSSCRRIIAGETVASWAVRRRATGTGISAPGSWRRATSDGFVADRSAGLRAGRRRCRCPPRGRDARRPAGAVPRPRRRRRGHRHAARLPRSVAPAGPRRLRRRRGRCGSVARRRRRDATPSSGSCRSRSRWSSPRPSARWTRCSR